MLRSNDDEPAHGEIKTYPGRLVSPSNQGLHQDSDNGQPPDEPEQSPAPRPAKHAKRERRVRPRDEEKYGAVIQNEEQALGPTGR